MHLTVDLLRCADGRLEGTVITDNGREHAFSGTLDLLRILEDLEPGPGGQAGDAAERSSTIQAGDAAERSSTIQAGDAAERSSTTQAGDAGLVPRSSR